MQGEGLHFAKGIEKIMGGLEFLFRIRFGSLQTVDPGQVNESQAGFKGLVVGTQDLHRFFDLLIGLIQPVFLFQLEPILQIVSAQLISRIRVFDPEVHLGEELTPEIVKQIAPDVLIIATGSRPLVPEIPGIGNKNVITSAEVLKGAKVGGKVVVVGGGLVGCETADYLAQQGKQVTIVEMLRRTAQDIGPAARYFLRRRMKEKEIKILTSTTVEEIVEGGVRVKTEEGSQVLGPVDTVVLATGAKSVNEMEPVVKEMVPEVYAIGDACKPGKILAAV